MRRGSDFRGRDFRVLEEEEKGRKQKKGYSPLPLGPLTRIYEYMRVHFKINPFRQKRGEIKRIMDKRIKAMDRIAKGQKTFRNITPKKAEALAGEYRYTRDKVWRGRVDVYSQIREQLGPISSDTKSHRRSGKVVRGYNRTYERWTKFQKDDIRQMIDMPTKSIVESMREKYPDMSITTPKVVMMKSRIRRGLA